MVGRRCMQHAACILRHYQEEQEMNDLNLKALLSSCKTIHQAFQIHSQMVVTGRHHDPFLMTSHISFFATPTFPSPKSPTPTSSSSTSSSEPSLSPTHPTTLSLSTKKCYLFPHPSPLTPSPSPSSSSPAPSFCFQNSAIRSIPTLQKVDLSPMSSLSTRFCKWMPVMRERSLMKVL